VGFWQRLNKHLVLSNNQLNHSDFWEQQAELNLDEDDFYDHLLQGELYHALVVGPTGQGKSKMIQALIQHLLYRQDQPCVVLLDPGGATAREMERWALTEAGQDPLILDPSEERYALSFNPMAKVAGLPLPLQARFLQESIFAALRLDERGRESVYYAPMIKQILYHLCHLLIETGFGLPQIPYLLSSKPTAAGAAMVERVQSQQVKDFWRDLQSLSPPQRQQTLSLLQAELLSFVTSEPIQRMMALPERALDFSQFIEQGGLFIADVEAGTALTALDSKLLTNLLISSVVRACFARPPYTGREVHLILEEAGDIEFTSEISLILRRARKQNLRFWVLNQDLMSMIEHNPRIFSMLWTNTTHKVAFGDLPFRDLEILALEFYGEQLDLKAIKDEIYRTYFEPKESERTIHSSGSSSSLSSMDSYSEGQGNLASSSAGEVYTEEGLLLPLHETIHLSQGSGAAHSRFSGSGSAHGSSQGYSESETIVPFYEFLKRRELSTRQFWAVEELLHQAKVELKGLRKGTIALKRRLHPVEILQVPRVPELPPLQNHQQLRERIFKQNPNYAKLEEIQAEREKRARQLTKENITLSD